MSQSKADYTQEQREDDLRASVRQHILQLLGEYLDEDLIGSVTKKTKNYAGSKNLSRARAEEIVSEEVLRIKKEIGGG